MCGIVGYLSADPKAYQREKKHFLRFALFIDTVRGYDSTGVIRVRTDKAVVDKKVQPGTQYVVQKNFLQEKETAWAGIGHNRAATAGSVKLANAHPFKFGAVTMVHNGTLKDGGRSLNGYNEDLEVDSMQIALALSLVPPEDAAKVLTTINGSFALVWHDARDNKIRMARNGQRPLHFTQNSKQDILWFMSDATHLKCLNDSLRGTKVEGHGIYSLDPNCLLIYSKGNLKPHLQKFGNYVPPAPPRREKKKLSKSADDKWREYLAERQARPKARKAVKVNGQERSIPAAHEKALETFYDLSPGDRLEFIPKKSFDVGNKKHYVIGDIILEHWGDCPWPAVIRDVPVVQRNAYWKQSWLVEPVGITTPLGNTDQDSAVLCNLLHCCFEKEEEPDDNIVELIEGPENRMIDKDRLIKLCESGCADCGLGILVDEARDCIFVNENRDLMCADCVNDYRELGETKQ